MDKYLDKFSSLVVVVYAWMTAVFFGGVLLDLVYFRILNDRLGTSDGAALFSEVSDIFLLFVFVLIVAAIAAIALSWRSATARIYFAASLLFIIFELLTPVIFSQFITNSQNFGFGPWLRITLNGLASLLAFIGLYKYFR